MQYGEWHRTTMGLRERRAYLHPFWGDSGFEYRWRQFAFVRRLADRLRREIVIEETTNLKMQVVQTMQRRDGSNYSRVIA